MPDQKALTFPRLFQQLGNSPPAHGDQSYKRTRISEALVIDTEQPSAKPEQFRAPIGDPLRLNLLFQESCPTVLQRGQIRAAYPARKQILGDSTQARLRWNDALIELFEPLSPPGELDRTERRLRRARNDVAHRGINLEKRLESRPQIHREKPQHLRTIGADRRGKVLVSGNRRPLRLRRHPKP